MLSKFDKMIQHIGDKKDVKRELRLAINNFFRAQGAGYNQAADTVTDWDETAGRLLTSYSQTLSQHKSQQSHRTHSVKKFEITLARHKFSFKLRRWVNKKIEYFFI